MICEPCLSGQIKLGDVSLRKAWQSAWILKQEVTVPNSPKGNKENDLLLQAATQ